MCDGRYLSASQLDEQHVDSPSDPFVLLRKHKNISQFGMQSVLTAQQHKMPHEEVGFQTEIQLPASSKQGFLYLDKLFICVDVIKWILLAQGPLTTGTLESLSFMLLEQSLDIQVSRMWMQVSSFIFLSLVGQQFAGWGHARQRSTKAVTWPRIVDMLRGSPKFFPLLRLPSRMGPFLKKSKILFAVTRSPSR
jgi:hypothetical protein